MKKITGYFRWAIFVALGVSQAGCLMTRNDIAEEENKKSVQVQVSHLQKSNADAAAKYSEINEDMRTMGGRIDALENRIQSSNQHREKAQNLTDQQIAETNKKVLALQEELQKIQGQVKVLSEEIVKMSTAQAAAAHESSTSGESASSKGGEKKVDYYKIADTYFAKKDWKSAAANYEKYRDAYPNGKKYALATFKIGIAFQELGMREDAKAFFDDVISKNPNSELAKRAKERLKKK